jgi:hypothetical protein
VRSPFHTRRQAVFSAVAIGAVAVVAVVAAAIQLAGSTPAPPSQGPLEGRPADVLLNLIPVDVGRPVTVGLFLPDRRVPNLTIDGVRPIRLQPGLRVVGYRVLYTNENHGGLEGADGFPPAGWITHPMRHSIVSGNASGTDILVGLEATEPGVHNVLSFVVSYHVGPESYRAVLYHGVTLCAPRMGGKECSRRGVTHLVTALQIRDALRGYDPVDNAFLSSR